jgi:GMP synthase (glutamine-hydrolysing)
VVTPALLDGHCQDFTTPDGHGMLHVWMSHGDKVTEMPPGFKLMASTDSCPIAGMADEEPGASMLCSSTRK